MKRLELLLIMLLLMATSVNSQIRKTVYARGPVTTADRTAGSFQSLRVSTGIDVILTQGAD